MCNLLLTYVAITFLLRLLWLLPVVMGVVRSVHLCVGFFGCTLSYLHPNMRKNDWQPGLPDENFNERPNSSEKGQKETKPII